MLPFSSSRSSTFCMSNWAYLASRTPSARFSKSQNSAIFVISGGPAMVVPLEFVVAIPPYLARRRRRSVLVRPHGLAHHALMARYAHGPPEGVSQVLIVCAIVLVFGHVSPMASTPVKHPPYCLHRVTFALLLFWYIWTRWRLASVT